MEKKITDILIQNSIEIKDLNNIFNDLEIFFANTNLTEQEKIKLLKIISKIN